MGSPYFIIEKEIKSTFAFLENSYPGKIKEEILSSEAVSIHVRLTYYLEVRNGMENVCTLQYYQNAMKIINDKTLQPKFFVFSDDIPLAKQKLNMGDCPNVVFIENDAQEDTALRDLYYMSLCKHHIIANSTFSWWGAWMGSREDSIVVMPSIWDGQRAEWDMAMPSWIKADIE